jgi:hypothetical protein
LPAIEHAHDRGDVESRINDQGLATAALPDDVRVLRERGRLDGLHHKLGLGHLSTSGNASRPVPIVAGIGWIRKRGGRAVIL